MLIATNQAGQTGLDALHLIGPKITRASEWYHNGASNDAAWRALNLRDKVYYEIGQKTLPSGFEKYAKLTPVQKGQAYVLEQGWVKAILPTKSGVKLGIGETFHTGPTPVFRYLVPRIIIVGGASYVVYEHAQ